MDTTPSGRPSLNIHLKTSNTTNLTVSESEEEESRDSTPTPLTHGKRGRKPSTEVPLKKQVTVAKNKLGTQLSQRSHKAAKQNQVYQDLKGRKIELSDLDVDGDGTIGTSELSVFVRLYNTFVEDYKRMTYMLIFLCIGVCILWLTVFATVIPLGLLSAEVRHNSDKVVTDSEGVPLRIEQAVGVSEFSCAPEDTTPLEWLIFPDTGKEAVLAIKIRNNGTEALVTTVNGNYLFPCAQARKRASNSGGTTAQVAPATLEIYVSYFQNPTYKIVPGQTFTINVPVTIKNVPSGQVQTIQWIGDFFLSGDELLSFFGFSSLQLTQSSRVGDNFVFSGTFRAPPREGLIRPIWKVLNVTIMGNLDFTCSDGIFCNGYERYVQAYGCVAATQLPCKSPSGNACASYQCLESLKRCDQEPLGGASCPRCAALPCTPSCANGQQCGDDGCGGVCGTCTGTNVCLGGVCQIVTQLGSCANPAPLLDTPGSVVPDAGLLKTIFGDNTAGNVDMVTPVCNLPGVPEYVYKFTISNTVEGGGMGFEIRMLGADGDIWADTLLAVHDANCNSFSLTPVDRLCSDDQNPPGGYSSRVSGKLPPGTYTLIATNYDTPYLSAYQLQMKFVPDCYPKCEAVFCGSDGCGGSCGTCEAPLICSFSKCQQSICEPACHARKCGPDGCGGVCGDCKNKQVCDLNEGVCVPVKACNGLIPDCPSKREGKGPDKYCGSDCQWHRLSDIGPDLIPSTAEEILRSTVYYWDNFPEGSCVVEEGCVGGTGDRALMTFDTFIHNIGTGDYVGPSIGQNPQLYVWGSCHQHYHHQKSTRFALYSPDGKSLVLGGAKLSYCLEDEYQFLYGSETKCSISFDCMAQGIPRGRSDLYSFGLDCQWLDITTLPKNCWYTYEVCVNVARNVWELDYDNNCVRVPVYVPYIPNGVRMTLAEAIARDNANSFTGCKP